MIVKGVSWFFIFAVCLAVIPLAANAGLLILGTEPNPRHPPADLLGEAVGWAIIGALSGAVCTIIAESLTMRDETGFFVSHKGLIIGATVGIVLSLFFGMNLAVLQMPSVDGQAITSVNLGIMAGATVGLIGCLAGIVMGFILRRAVLALAT